MPSSSATPRSPSSRRHRRRNHSQPPRRRRPRGRLDQPRSRPAPVPAGARPDRAGDCSSSRRAASGPDRFELRGRQGRGLRRRCLDLIGDLHSRCRRPGDRADGRQRRRSPAVCLPGRVGMVLSVAVRGGGRRHRRGGGRVARLRPQRWHRRRGEDPLRSRRGLRPGLLDPARFELTSARRSTMTAQRPPLGRRPSACGSCVEAAGARAVARRRRHELPPRAADRAGLRPHPRPHHRAGAGQARLPAIPRWPLAARARCERA